MLTSSVASSERDSSGKEKVEKNSELDWRWLSWAQMELGVTFTETGGDVVKSRIQIIYRKMMIKIGDRNMYLDNLQMLLSLVPDAPHLS